VSSLGDRFRLVSEGHAGVAQSVFTAAVLDEGLTCLRNDSWPTAVKELAVPGEQLFFETNQHQVMGVWRHSGALVHLTLSGSWLHVATAAASDEQTQSAVAHVRSLFPLPDPSSSQEVPVTFWTYTLHGPMPSMRTIAVPEWSEIDANYSAETRAALEAIMHRFRPAHGGQLLLWHGTAGTGKTFALRALAWEWRDWCRLHYVVDPDTFFGEHADYLMNVLMQPGMPMTAFSGGMAGGWTSMVSTRLAGAGTDDGEETQEQAWRLLVLEDTGELLTPDAKSVIGQGLSRFLNVVDGLLGQGLRVLVLVTTNEEIQTLHPAVARPGRAAANVEFGTLSEAEAAAWLESHGVEAKPSHAATLASLYALREGRDPGEPPAATAFGDS